jgi:hypothetical protein
MYALYILLKTFNIQTPQYSASQQSLKILIFTPPLYLPTRQQPLEKRYYPFIASSIDPLLFICNCTTSYRFLEQQD